jgi:hypothetical protein
MLDISEDGVREFAFTISALVAGLGEKVCFDRRVTVIVL